MRRKPLSFCTGLLVLLTVLAGCASQQELAFRAVESKTHSAVTPANRDGARHQAFNERVKQGNVDLIFIGDSITHSWEKAGKDVWEEYYGHRNAVNLGIGGDRTGHVLWRLDNGNIDGISPKVAVVMIGTNNHPPRNTGEEIADGIIAICKKLRTKLPKTKILLLGIFPRGAKPNPMREELAKASGTASRIADGKMIHYLDIGDKFVKADGTISKEIMHDYLHLSTKGYRIWAEAIEPKLIELMGETGRSRRSCYRH
ncbi:MAG: platelet-activating factor acetylhydrolase IB subunit [Planctomycetota bacterium]|jgi:beta-glucosidase